MKIEERRTGIYRRIIKSFTLEELPGIIPQLDIPPAQSLEAFFDQLILCASNRLIRYGVDVLKERPPHENLYEWHPYISTGVRYLKIPPSRPPHVDIPHAKKGVTTTELDGLWETEVLRSRELLSAVHSLQLSMREGRTSKIVEAAIYLGRRIEMFNISEFEPLANSGRQLRKSKTGSRPSTPHIQARNRKLRNEAATLSQRIKSVNAIAKTLSRNRTLNNPPVSSERIRKIIADCVPE